MVIAPQTGTTLSCVYTLMDNGVVKHATKTLSSYSYVANTTYSILANLGDGTTWDAKKTAPGYYMWDAYQRGTVGTTTYNDDHVLDFAEVAYPAPNYTYNKDSYNTLFGKQWNNPSAKESQSTAICKNSPTLAQLRSYINGKDNNGNAVNVYWVDNSDNKFTVEDNNGDTYSTTAGVWLLKKENIKDFGTSTSTSPTSAKVNKTDWEKLDATEKKKYFFLSAASCYEANGTFNPTQVGHHGYYWSSTVYNDSGTAWYIHFTDNEIRVDNTDRKRGLRIMTVQ